MLMVRLILILISKNNYIKLYNHFIYKAILRTINKFLKIIYLNIVICRSKKSTQDE